jgi:hypothetical protein
MAPAGPEPGINKVVAGARRAGNGIGALRLVRWGARPRNRRTHRAAGTGGRLQQLTCTLDMAPVADRFSCPRPPRCVCRMTRRLFRPSTTISAAATNARRSSTHRAVFPTTSEPPVPDGPHHGGASSSWGVQPPVRATACGGARRVGCWVGEPVQETVRMVDIKSPTVWLESWHHPSAIHPDVQLISWSLV